MREKDAKPTGTLMAQQFAVLAAELERVFGSTRVIPTRAELRAMSRGDIEKVPCSPNVPCCNVLGMCIDIHHRPVDINARGNRVAVGILAGAAPLQNLLRLVVV